MMTETLFDSTTFRQVCGQFPTGVTAITAVTQAGELAALTVNSFTSVSLEPAKVLFCLATSSSSFAHLRDARRVAIHILAADQEDIARRFATSGLSGEAKLEGIAWSAGPDDVPVLDAAPAILSGAIDEVVTSGDHVIIILDIDAVRLRPSDVPALSFYRGRFANPAD